MGGVAILAFSGVLEFLGVSIASKMLIGPALGMQAREADKDWLNTPKVPQAARRISTHAAHAAHHGGGALCGSTW